MKIVADRIKQLRESLHLSQMRLSTLNGCNQSSIARYENDQSDPSPETLLWYSDYFDVSLDYIFGRTDHPQGKLYEYNPKITADSAEMKQFIEMCFDPNSPVSERMKKTLIDMFIKENGG